MDKTKRYIADGTETGAAFWIVDTTENKTIGLLDRTHRESLNLVVDALNHKATFDQAREALKPFAKVAQALGDTKGDWLWVQSHSDPSKNVGIRFEDVQNALKALAAMEETP